MNRVMRIGVLFLCMSELLRSGPLCNRLAGNRSLCNGLSRSVLAKQSSRLFNGGESGCNPAHVKEVNSFKTPCKTRIVKLKHLNGNYFLVKQKQCKSLLLSFRRYLGVACEKLGSYVALSVGVLTNRVEIIPWNYTFPGKYTNQVPATLHEVVPGFKVNALPEQFKSLKVYIQQPVKPTIPEKEWGLTRQVLHDMALHPDLPLIVALDTFIANGDRHRGNFLYDPQSHRFFVIDAESAFDKDLASYACMCIESMINNKKEKISKAEYHALRVYRNTLKKLISSYTPQDLYRALVTFIIQGGILSQLSCSRLSLITKPYEQHISKNYVSCQKLVTLIDILLVQQARKLRLKID